MTDAKLIDGRAAADALRGRIAADVAALKQSHGVTPGLAVVLVGEDPSSLIYVRSNSKQRTSCGMASVEHRRPESISQADLSTLLDDLNRDDAIHGILVQLPLPAHIDEHFVLSAVAPENDSAGFHVLNAGRPAAGIRAFAPCTPLGWLALLVADSGGFSCQVAGVVVRLHALGQPIPIP